MAEENKIMIGAGGNRFDVIADGDSDDVVTQNSDGTKSFKPPRTSGGDTWQAEAGTIAPPSSGKIRWNNASQLSATKLFVSTSNKEGDDLTNFLQQVVVNDAFYIQNQSDSSQYQYWGITAIASGAGYEEYDVTLIQSTGADFSTIGQGDNLLTSYRPGGLSTANYQSSVSGVEGESPSLVDPAFNDYAFIYDQSNGSLKTTDFTKIDDLIFGKVEFLDPTAGNINYALPDPSVNEGKKRTIKRITNGGNYVEITGNIDGLTVPFILGVRNDYVTFLSDGTTWRVINQRTFAYASMKVSAPTTFALTTSWTKFTGWDEDIFSTGGRLVADHTDDSIEVLNFKPPNDYYHVELLLNIEYTSNRTVEAQIYFNNGVTSVPVGEEFAVNATGSGKPVTIALNEGIPITEAGKFELWLKGESAGTLDVLKSTITINRIGG